MVGVRAPAACLEPAARREENGRKPVLTVLVVGDGTVEGVVGDALAGLHAGLILRESGEGLGDALSDPALRLGVVDLRSGTRAALERLDRERPDVPVVAIVSAGATSEAVDAMKVGAEEAVEWPVGPGRMGEIVRRLLDRDRPAADREYAARVEAARLSILERTFAVARAQLMRALEIDVLRPEALNLLGVLDQARGARVPAQTWWRMALLVDGAFAPARDNLTRSVRRPGPTGPLRLR